MKLGGKEAQGQAVGAIPTFIGGGEEEETAK
jgi:hypothetical protein